jgi:sulfide:quinone oxidoreductase
VGVPTHVVILGAGFGGLELSSRLTEELGDDVAVTLIDQSDAFMFGFSKLDVMFGRQQFDEARIPYAHLTRPSVPTVRGERGREARVRRGTPPPLVRAGLSG